MDDSYNWNTLLKAPENACKPGQVYVLLISGIGINEKDAASAVSCAKKIGFGGFDYLGCPADINNLEALRQLFENINALFNKNATPSFESFSDAVHPVEQSATRIKRQFLRSFGRRYASIISPTKLEDSDRTFEICLEKLDLSKQNSLVALLKKFEKIDAERAQLRHGTFSNGVWNSIRAKSRLIREKERSPSLREDLISLVYLGVGACGEADTLARRWEDLGKELKVLNVEVQLKECFGEDFWGLGLFSTEADTIRARSGKLQNDLDEVRKHVQLDPFKIDDRTLQLLVSAEASCANLISALELKG